MEKDAIINVLCFVDNDRGRDVEMLIPVGMFSERFLNCRFKYAFVYDTFAIWREMPDIVVLPNTVGSHYYYEISKYAYDQKIPVFALTSEGNFRTDGSFNYWGYNKDKFFYQEYICLWSERTANFLKSELPHFKDNIVVTGGTGFDRYKILSKINRKEYLQSKGIYKEYSKVIGYAGWAFGKLFNKQGVEELLYFFSNDKNKLSWVEDQRRLVESALKYAIEQNPDILFILKKHPNENNPSIIKEGLNEMNQLTSYSNVLYLNQEESVHDIIQISDLWLAFESTTVIEAWLLEKETIFINPDPDFNRDPNYKGCILVENGERLNNYIQEFYRNESLTDFYSRDKAEARSTIIRNTIGFADGCNHIRASFYLQKIIQSKKYLDKKRKFSAKYFIMFFLLYVGRFFYIKSVFEKLPKFKKTVWVFERYRLKNIGVLYKRYYEDYKRFYKNINVESDFLSGRLYQQIMEKEHDKHRMF